MAREVSANVALLVEKLAQWYPLDHPVVVYVASLEPGEPHHEQRCHLADLPTVPVTSASTLTFLADPACGARRPASPSPACAPHGP